jgi:hypothetical protein
MLELRALARHVSDAAFGQFRRQLKYKATWYGTEVVVADRWFPSSKTCSGCGTINPTCRCRAGSTTAAPAPLVIDRDVNAAVNLARYTAPPPKTRRYQRLPDARTASAPGWAGSRADCHLATRKGPESEPAQDHPQSRVAAGRQPSTPPRQGKCSKEADKS